MAIDHKQLEADFADDSMTISDIADKHGLTWDWVQRERAKYRRLNGLAPIKRGPRPASNTPVPKLGAQVYRNQQAAERAWHDEQSPMQKQLRELFPNEASTADRLEQIEIKLDRILEILEDVD